MKIVKLLTALLLVTTSIYSVVIPRKKIQQRSLISIISQKIATVDQQIKIEKNPTKLKDLRSIRTQLTTRLEARRANNRQSASDYRARRKAEGKPSRKPRMTICQKQKTINTSADLAQELKIT